MQSATMTRPSEKQTSIKLIRVPDLFVNTMKHQLFQLQSFPNEQDLRSINPTLEITVYSPKPNEYWACSDFKTMFTHL
jgi:hypothetical protein